MQQAPFTLNELLHPALWLLWVLGASKPIVSPAEEVTGLALDNGHRGAAPPFTTQGFMFTPAPSDALAAFRILKAPLQEAVSTPAPPPLVPRDSSLGCQWPVCIPTTCSKLQRLSLSTKAATSQEGHARTCPAHCQSKSRASLLLLSP